MANVLARAGVLLCLVPLVPVVELALHAKQTSSVVSDEDWASARDAVKAQIEPDDLVVFSPFWADPLGRRAFGDAIASRKREARSDERRFRRAFEVSIRGAHDPALVEWKKIDEKHAGDVTITLRENPSYTPVLDDVLEKLERLTVTRVDAAGEQPCTFQHGSTAGGSTVVPQGLLTPAEKFVCSGGHVGIAVLDALDHRPHVCLYATPIAAATLRLRFANVRFGSSLFGHAGIQWMAERTPSPERVAMAFYGDGHLLGTHGHKVGSGWTGFELPTPELEGKTGELVAEIGPSTQRQFCFEATTRGSR
jgi:hypothetical protein